MHISVESCWFSWNIMTRNSTSPFLRHSHKMTHMVELTGPSLLHIMVWFLFSTKPLPEIMMIYLHLSGPLVTKLNSNHDITIPNHSIKFFQQVNTFENIVSKLPAILLRSKCATFVLLKTSYFVTLFFFKHLNFDSRSISYHQLTKEHSIRALRMGKSSQPVYIIKCCCWGDNK